MTDQNETRTKIAEREESIEQTLELLAQGEVPEANRPGALRMLGGDAEWLGDYYGLVDEPGPAREWFGEATRYFLRYLGEREDETWREMPVQLINLLYCAVLSGDDEVLTEAAGAVLDVPETFPETYPVKAPWYHYVRGLASSVAGDEAALEEQLVALDDARERSDLGFDEFFAALSGVLDGFLHADADRIERAVDRLAADLLASEDDPHYARMAASALVALASRRGLDVAAPTVVATHDLEHGQGDDG